MKIKNAAVFLMISSIFWIVCDLYGTVQRFVGPSSEYYKEHLVDGLIQTLMIIIPVSLLFLSLALINKKSEQHTVEIFPQAAEDPEAQNLSVSDWLLIFLITIIPLVGFIFVIIWANDDRNKVRKNWAVASLIWTAIMTVIFIFLYTAMLNAVKHRF